jgi:hypothetical protein
MLILDNNHKFACYFLSKVTKICLKHFSVYLPLPYRGDNLRRPNAIPKGVGGTDWPIRIRRLPSPPPLTYHWHWHWGLKLSPLVIVQGLNFRVKQYIPVEQFFLQRRNSYCYIWTRTDLHLSFFVWKCKKIQKSTHSGL